jgi:hypothetical protein
MLIVVCYAHANRMPLAWQSYNYSWMIEDIILNNIININYNRNFYINKIKKIIK